MLSASQICVGEENGLTLRVHGETGTIKWAQENPNELWVQGLEGSRRLVTRGGPGVSTDAAARATRLPAGHPEGFIEGFANVYRGAYEAIRAGREGREPTGLGLEYPNVEDGARGVRFINAVIDSDGAWVSPGS